MANYCENKIIGLEQLRINVQALGQGVTDSRIYNSLIGMIRTIGFLLTWYLVLILKLIGIGRYCLFDLLFSEAHGFCSCSLMPARTVAVLCTHIAPLLDCLCSKEFT